MKNLVRVLAVLALLIPSLALAGELSVGIAAISSGAIDMTEYNITVGDEIGNLSLSGSYAYAERDGERYDEKGSASVEYDITAENLAQKFMTVDGGRIESAYSPLSIWVFDRAATDWAQEIRLENFAGTGLKYTVPGLVDSANLSLSVGYLNHMTGYYGTKPKTEVHRASVRPKATYKAGNWDLRLIGFYQPCLDDADDDYILMSTASVGYWFSNKLGLALSREDEYRSVSLVDEKHSARTLMMLTSRW